MATLPARAVKVGKIIDKALGVVERAAVPALIFVAVVTVLCASISYFTVGSTSFTRIAGAEVLKSAIGVVCGYFLLVAMVRRTGLYARADDDAFLPFIGLSLLSTLGVMLGMIAFILPGLFIMARWSIAQPLLVAGGRGVMPALGESWERTKGLEFQIIGAALVLLIPVIVITIGVSAFFEQGDPVRIVVSQIASSGTSAVFLAMGVALYGMMVGPAQPAATPA
ncbi:MAG TPA: hypothetical protein VEB68_03830 [Croceibacterium sp.]|nr:hypothetical protein [Croceibacterium sp.]